MARAFEAAGDGGLKELRRARKALDEGHGFSRAIKSRSDEGFSP
jgi:hypothetical protein